MECNYIVMEIYKNLNHYSKLGTDGGLPSLQRQYHISASPSATNTHCTHNYKFNAYISGKMQIT